VFRETFCKPRLFFLSVMLPPFSHPPGHFPSQRDRFPHDPFFEFMNPELPFPFFRLGPIFKLSSLLLGKGALSSFFFSFVSTGGHFSQCFSPPQRASSDVPSFPYFCRPKPHKPLAFLPLLKLLLLPHSLNTSTIQYSCRLLLPR